MKYYSPKNHLGRVQRGIHRAFVVSDGKPLSTSEIMLYTHARKLLGGQNCERWRHHWRRAIRGAAEVLCVRAGRSKTGTGRPVLWRLRDPVE